ncbi:class I SAM-dependent methyltransferase [Singulisphaera rosea]
MGTEIDTESAGIYEGPTTTSEFTIGSLPIRLVRPTDPDRLLDVPEIVARNRRDDYMPYWAYLWPGAFLLAEAVVREPLGPGLSVLEIGCGLGLAGLIGVGRGLRVRFTDYDEDTLRFVGRSAEANGFDPSSYSIGRLDWRDLPDERYPVIIGADVLYERRLVPLVGNLIARLLEPDGVALIAGPYRVASANLEVLLSPWGLVTEAESIAATGEAGPVRGTLHRIRHKSR